MFGTNQESVVRFMAQEYRCKIADCSDMERKWEQLIADAGADRANWIAWKKSAIRQAAAGETLPYYGILDEEIICEATACLCAKVVQNAAGLVGEKTAYLCAFRTLEAYRGKGYFSKLLRWLLNDLKQRGYEAVTLGVEPKEEQNRQIYAHYGFDEYVKTATERYPDGAAITVDYYRKKL
ncbi:MAG: GNAT family N-acetyltransferase [Subdoligranulum sp.]|nr:GNAT family N-acetyltransferase [Subdoligranulum sp.]